MTRYERAYVDFFEDELVLKGYDWKKVVVDYAFSGENPLGKCLISGRMFAEKSTLLEFSRVYTHSYSSRSSADPSWLCLRVVQSGGSHGSPRPSSYQLEFPSQIP